ncbi:nucleoside deaminase [Pararoseomonas indoligenes]|uniref:Nucleoside deaminase n=1 Tax=Roseomonas indoligenes TaxID=2820811 RepID=A0A940S5C6_9PROT|nr:nucleoside deaminase [Pararoseomonas indoligenes]MBP0492805.1 nucleoside deaminase [Pararoseomonas indoligenes]
MTEHETMMRLAIEQAKHGATLGEQPFGALVAKDGAVVVKTWSKKVGLCDATAHSETLAVGMACRALGRRELPDCTFYATCEPCPMCLGAILNGGFKRLVLGARNAEVKRLANKAFNFGGYSVESFAATVGWDLEVVDGVLTDECVGLYVGAGVELTR